MLTGSNATLKRIRACWPSCSAQALVCRPRSPTTLGAVVVDIRRASAQRRGSPLGNPFVLRDPRDSRGRDIVCDAYDALLGMALMGGGGKGPASTAEVAAFGRVFGHEGPLGPWDAVGACAEIDRLVSLSRTREVRLRCSCGDERCHGESIARHVRQEREWRHGTFCEYRLPSLI